MLRNLRGRGLWAAVFLISSGLFWGCAGSALDAPGTVASRFPLLQTEEKLPYPFLDELMLSSEQRKAIREIIDTYRPKTDPEVKKQWREDLKDTLSAPNLDVAKLRELVTQEEQKRKDMLTNTVPMFVAIRGVLTQEQLDTAVSKIAEMRKPQPESSPSPDAQPTAAPTAAPTGRPVGPDIRLTDKQRELWKQLRPPKLDRDAILAAVSTLLHTGDSKPLSEALRLQEPIEARVTPIVDALSSLTTEQRRALVDYKPSPAPSSEDEATSEEEASPSEDEKASPSDDASASPSEDATSSSDK